MEISNTRYAEKVRVQLLKSIPSGGFEEVGSLTQSVPARSKSHTTDFPFSYTFTQDDAAAGRVTSRPSPRSSTRGTRCPATTP